MNKREIRIPLTHLKKYLQETNITVTYLAEQSGINLNHLHKCLAGYIDERNGQVRTLSDDNMAHLQEALHQLALRMKYVFILYNTDCEVVKRNGSRYCPNCLEQIKEQLSPYINILPFLQNTLGWSRTKARNILDCYSNSFGNISQDDVNRINIKIAETATLLEMLTVIKQ